MARETLVDFNKSSSVLKAYAHYAVQAAKMMRDSLKSDVKDHQIEVEVESMLKFESLLANVLTIIDIIYSISYFNEIFH